MYSFKEKKYHGVFLNEKSFCKLISENDIMSVSAARDLFYLISIQHTTKPKCIINLLENMTTYDSIFKAAEDVIGIQNYNELKETYKDKKEFKNKCYDVVNDEATIISTDTDEVILIY